MNRCSKWVVRTLHLPALLGLATASFAQAPVAWGGDAHIPSLNTLRKIDRVSVGVNHVLAVSNDGHVLQFGTLQGSPVPAGLINPRSIAAGNDFSLAVTSAGSIVGWGGSANNPGRTMIPSGSGFLQVRAGDRRGAAIRSDGSFVLWGKSQFGETDVPQDVRRVRQLAIGADFMAAITPEGQLRAWGRVIGDTNGNITSTVPAGSDFVDVKASPDGHHAVALRADGTVAAWGLNSDGQMTVPERLSNPLHPQFRRVRSIAAGARHSIALLQNGFTIRWGAKDLGQTANPPTAATFEQVFAGGNTNVGITAKPVARWSFDQATVVGGSVKTVCATLTLNEPAADPLTIRLESEDPQCVSVPTVVSIPKGASSGTFQLTHRVVGDLKTVPMNASGDIAPARGSIRVTPNWSTA